MKRHIDRRAALKLAVLASAGTAFDMRAASTKSHNFVHGDSIVRFHTPLPIPAELASIRSDGDSDCYELRATASNATILPGLQTPIWGYNGMFPGPTIRAQRGRTVRIRFTNDLKTPTVTHLHGGHTPSSSDGFPTDVILPVGDKSVLAPAHNMGHHEPLMAMMPAKYEETFSYPNEQRAATLWYHDHAMGFTGRNVYMGLAGFYLIEDDHEAALGLPSGRYDIPLMLCTRKFEHDGRFRYMPHGHEGAGGDVMIVNGAAWPFLRVERRKYRFRILNASNATTFTLALSSHQPLVQIATDGGLMEGPVESEKIPMAMAERVEVVIDFSKYDEGTSLTLQNLEKTGALGDVMRFDVVGLPISDDSRVPERLSSVEVLAPEMAVRTRTFTFGARPEFKLHFPPIYFSINGKRFDPDHPEVTPKLGEIEIWRFVYEKTRFPKHTHPPHVHLTNYQILDRNGKTPPPYERGWKDTLRLDAGDDVRVIMRFDDYRGRYLMHCHNLEHEDYDMMMRFDVV